MKKFLVLALVFAFTAIANASFDYDLRMDVDFSDPGPTYAPYRVDLDLDGSYDFDTFCVERDSTFGSGRYYATVNDRVYFSPVNDGTTSNGVSESVKKMYSAFLNGELNAFSGNVIQNAIWHEMGFASTWQAGNIVDVLISTIDSYDTSGSENVKALNLWKRNNGEAGIFTQAMDAQSHLIRVPAPGAVLLAGIGTSLIGLIRRRSL